MSDVNVKDSVTNYCRAQSNINKIEKDNEEKRKILNERIKTCRSLIHDELTQKQISCFEMFQDGDEPLYFRLKPVLPNDQLSADDIITLLQSVNREVLSVCAEKCNHDLPKMLSVSLQNQVKKKRQESATEKTTLSISSSKERGYNRVSTEENVSEEITQVANDLIAAKKELGELKQKQSEEKKPNLEEQKKVEKTVKDALKQSDPKNMTTRIHMMQGDSEWVYYLRCKETERSQPM